MKCGDCPFCLKKLPDGNFIGDCGAQETSRACQVMREFYNKITQPLLDEIKRLKAKCGE